MNSRGPRTEPYSIWFIPTSVIKSCADVFALLIAQLAKLYFSEDKFTSRYKAYGHLTLEGPRLRRCRQLQTRLQPTHHYSRWRDCIHSTHPITRRKLSSLLQPLSVVVQARHSTETTLLRMSVMLQTITLVSRSMQQQPDLSAA